MEDETRVLEIEEPRRLVMRAGAGLLGSAIVRVLLEPDQRATRVVMEEEFESGRRRRHRHQRHHPLHPRPGRKTSSANARVDSTGLLVSTHYFGTDALGSVRHVTDIHSEWCPIGSAWCGRLRRFGRVRHPPDTAATATGAT